jgi:hypothetical protein
MKNQRILLIASLLLVLCVYEKQASNKAARMQSVEKMYNFPAAKWDDVLLSTHNSTNSQLESKKLYNITRDVSEVAGDSLLGGSGKISKQAIF